MDVVDYRVEIAVGEKVGSFKEFFVAKSPLLASPDVGANVLHLSIRESSFVYRRYNLRLDLVGKLAEDDAGFQKGEERLSS